MVKTSLKTLKGVLKQKMYDYCLLLPMFEENPIMTIETCYMSEKNTADFLCFEHNYDGTISLEIHWGQEDTSEIIDLLIYMKHNSLFEQGCNVCLYKSTYLLDRIFNECAVDHVVALTSYYSNGQYHDYDHIFEKSCDFIIDKNVFLENSFVVQRGNHIKILRNQLNNSPLNNKIIYLQIGNQIIGYIALTKHYKNIWDVAYIFINENYRNNGYATLLCKKAQQILYQHNQVLFYSYCESTASEKVAQKSGLLPCAERHIFTTNFEGLGE